MRLKPMNVLLRSHIHVWQPETRVQNFRVVNVGQNLIGAVNKSCLKLQPNYSGPKDSIKKLCCQKRLCENAIFTNSRPVHLKLKIHLDVNYEIVLGVYVFC